MSTVKLHVGPTTYEAPEMELDTGHTREAWDSLTLEVKASIVYGLESKYRCEMLLSVYETENI